MLTENNPDQNFENFPEIKEAKAAKEKMAKKPLFIFVSIFAFVLLAFLGLAIFMSFNQKNLNPTTENQPTPTPPTEIKEEITSPSPYATDAALLKTEEEIKTLDKRLQETDLKESKLNPPSLDWEIKFNKN